MNLEHTTYMGGRLIGIGKVLPDGTFDFHELDKPIHNHIVNSAFDHLFRFSAYRVSDLYSDYKRSTDTCTFTGYTESRGYNSDAIGRNGLLSFCKIGFNGTATTDTDTNLKSPGSDYSSTIVGGVPWSYVYKGPDGNGDYYLRVTHRVTATSSGNIAEIGWFGASMQCGQHGAGRVTTYHMFSRVVLDRPYTIASGEEMVVCYELHLKYADLIPVAVDMGLTAADGTPLKAMKGFESNIVNATSSGVSYISQSRFGLFDCTSNSSPGMGSHYSVTNHPTERITYSTVDRDFASDRNPNFTTHLTLPTMAPIVESNGATGSLNSRRITFTVPAAWPCLSDSTPSIDIHMLNVDGYTYRFGYYDAADNWVPQALRKTLTQTWQIRETVTYVVN